MPKPLAYYMSQKSSIPLEPIEALSEGLKVLLAYHLLSAAMRPHMLPDPISACEQIAKLTNTHLDVIVHLPRLEMLQLAACTLMTACDEIETKEGSEAQGDLLEDFLDTEDHPY
jgi:hypothetical protein